MELALKRANSSLTCGCYSDAKQPQERIGADILLQGVRALQDSNAPVSDLLNQLVSTGFHLFVAGVQSGFQIVRSRNRRVSGWSLI
ncbi:hypothetical protein LP7551_00081 [Roseibium album]|nr:hypothetical protein LP7551_00081 [Roseibium album]